MEQQRTAGVNLQPDDVSAIASLDEPVRRRLYDYIGQRRAAVSRDEAAEALGLTRSTAAFHLDRLVEEGLLTAEFARLTGRTGPGSGRPSKLYRRSGREIEVSLPGRQYELMGQLLVGTIVEAQEAQEAQKAQEAQPARGSGAESLPSAILGRRARELGETIGAQARGGADLVGCLAEFGFEPRMEDDVIRLGNCPFHALAAQHAELVCGMNLDLLDGVVDGIGATGYRADLDPEDGYCCVRLRPSGDVPGQECACHCRVEPGDLP